MFTKHGRRCIALLVVLTTVISLMPFQTLATEINPQEGIVGQEVIETFEDESVEGAVLGQVQDQIDEFLIRYLGCTVMDFGEIQTVVEGMDWETYQTARYELSELENSLVALMENGKLSEVELETLINSNTVLCNFSDVLEMRNAEDNEVSLYATTVNVLDGKVSITDTATSMSVSGNTVTVTAKGGLLSQTTNTITICNGSGKTATISFDYSASNYGSFSESTATGSKSVLLDSGATITMSIKGKSVVFGNTATLTLSNFSLVEAATSSNVTFEYDSSLGSIAIGGTAVSPGTTIEGISVDTGAAAVATTSGSGVTFLGWVNTADGSVLSKLASDTLKPTESMTVKAVFVNSSSIAWFLAGGTNMFDDLNEAASFASSAASKTVVLMHSGALSVDTYNIPSGVKLLIPHSANDTGKWGTISDGTLSVDEPDNGYSTAKPTPFRTLTVPSGAIINCAGSINVNGYMHCTSLYDNPTGETYGPCGYIDLDGTINMNSGSVLTCYGFIIGDGMVNAASGAHVVEFLSIGDYRGGSQTSAFSNTDTYKHFPFSQYYVQNIEADYVINVGAKSYILAGFYVSLSSLYQDNLINLGVMIAQSEGLFRLTEGKLTRSYSGTDDRVTYKLEGTMTAGGLEVSIAVGTYAKTFNSADYVMAINSNITMQIESGKMIIAEDFRLLPEAKVIVNEGAELVVDSTAKCYIYDLKDWVGRGYCKWSQDMVRKRYSPTRDGITFGSGTVRTLDESAQITVDGSLSIYGNLFVTAGWSGGKSASDLTVVTADDSKSSDKVITGKGKIINYAAWSTGDLTEMQCTDGSNADSIKVSTIYTAPAVGYLSGISTGTQSDGTGDYHTFATGTATAPIIYHGLGDGYWYNYAVTAEKTDGRTAVEQVLAVPTVAMAGVSENTITRGDSTISNVVGLISQYYNGTSNVQSTYTFNVPIPKVKGVELEDSSTATLNSTGTTEEKMSYSLTGVSADTTLVLDVLFDIVATNIAVEDSLDMYFYVLKEDLVNGDAYYAVVTKDFADNREDNPIVSEIPYSEWEESGIYMRFCFSDISAKEMTDNLNAVVYNTGDQSQASMECDETVKKYAIRTLEEKTKAETEDITGTVDHSKLKTALVDMLIYGAQCQDIFQYNTENMANTGEEFDKYAKYATTTVPSCSDTDRVIGDKFVAASVSARERLVYTFYFDIDSVTDDTKAVIKYKNWKEEDKSITIEGSAFYPYETRGWYGVDVTPVSIVDGRSDLTCTVYNGSEVVASGTDSVEGYVARITNTSSSSHAVFTELMSFVDSARTYFSSVRTTT